MAVPKNISTFAAELCASCAHSDNLVNEKRRYVYSCHVKPEKFHRTQDDIVHPPRVRVGCYRYIFVQGYSQDLT